MARRTAALAWHLEVAALAFRLEVATLAYRLEVAALAYRLEVAALAYHLEATAARARLPQKEVENEAVYSASACQSRDLLSCLGHYLSVKVIRGPAERGFIAPARPPRKWRLYRRTGTGSNRSRPLEHTRMWRSRNGRMAAIV